ncbi:MAG: hypothetical protein JSW71_18820 [Gemmatimonadota bacterium]|nr:MAG: hypothetical protein JSW71_18820 [Gemmatimonadota bacterium]
MKEYLREVLKEEELVSRLVHILPVGLVLALASCGDSTGPPHQLAERDALGSISGPGVTAAALQPIRYDARMITRGNEPLFHVMALSASGDPQLETYELSFWAVRGREVTVGVDYVNNDQESGSFLSFTVPANGLYGRPDGTLFSQGDSVEITVTIDPDQLLVKFLPAGLVFNQAAPAQLQLWYEVAGGDLDGDGNVDADDGDVQHDRLGLWYQQDAGTLWYPIVSSHDSGREWFKTHLYHFSGYVVSWDK